MSCEYQVFSGKRVNDQSEIIACGRPGTNILLPNDPNTIKYFKNKRQVCLCEEHRLFIIDALEIPKEATDDTIQ